MDKKHIYRLVICLDKKGEKSTLLAQGTINEIDSITMSFNNSQELRSCYCEKEEEFEKKYKEGIEYLKTKYNRKETGDVTIIDPEKISVTDIPRESIVYKENIEMFEIAIDDLQFVQFLKNADYSKYCAIQRYNNEIDEQHKNIIDETISWLIRKMPKIYDEYAIKYNKPPLKTIYKHMKKERQLLQAYQKLYGNEIVDNYQGIYDESNNEPTEPEELEAYEKVFKEERNEERKYDIQETKGRQKIKKISGGK